MRDMANITKASMVAVIDSCVAKGDIRRRKRWVWSTSALASQGAASVSAQAVSPDAQVKRIADEVIAIAK